MDETDKDIFETLVDPMKFFPELGPQDDWFNEMYVKEPGLYEEWKSVGGKEKVLLDIYFYAKSKDFTEKNIIRLIKKYIQIRKDKYKEQEPMKPFVLDKMKEIIDKRVSIQEKSKKNNKGGKKERKTKKSKRNRKTRKSRK